MSTTIAYYERLLQEDLDCGTSTATRRNPGGGTLTGHQIGIHTVGLGQQSQIKTWTPGAIATGGQTTTTLTYTGAAVGNYVLAGLSVDQQSLSLTAYVSDVDTVTAVLSNLTGAEVTIGACYLYVLVLPCRATA